MAAHVKSHESVFYNEFDPNAAAWLRELVSQDLINPGSVDSRSILEVTADDLRGRTQVHLFAGIGVWSYAARLAGWPDDRPLWTASCPCFPEGTLVLTRQGYVGIEDVKVGDEVLTHRARWRRVSHTGSEVSETVTVKGQGHFGIQCTPGHPFLVGQDEWARAEDLTGKRWATIASVPRTEIPKPASSKLGYFYDRTVNGFRVKGKKDGKNVYIGVFATEEESASARMGAIKDGRIKVRGADGIDVNSVEFARFLGHWVGDGWVSGNSVIICGSRDDGALLREIMEGAGISAGVTIERTGAKARCGSVSLAQWLTFHFSKGASNKRIPAWLHGTSDAYRNAFLEGYMEADGHAESRPGCSPVRCITTVSKSLAVGVRVLFNQMGVSATITKTRRSPTTVIQGREVSQRDTFKVTAYENSRSFQFNGKHGWGYVRSVESSGTCRVYNIAVDEDESYTADGIVVHNCQPFSTAGKRKGTSDERHLWPVVADLVRECRPPIVVGEQVASPDGLGWLDAVFADLEGAGYACWATDTCAAGVGAPHIRQRLYWCAIRVADGDCSGRSRFGWSREEGTPEYRGIVRVGVTSGAGPQGESDRRPDVFGSCGTPPERAGGQPHGWLAAGGASGRLADVERQRVRSLGSGGAGGTPSEVQGGNGQRERLWPDAFTGDDAASVGLADADGRHASTERQQCSREYGLQQEDRRSGHADHRPRPTDGFWRDADWLACRDGKWRPVESGTFPLAHGAPARVGRLRGYGNAIVAPLAAEFLGTVLDVLDGRSASDAGDLI